MRIAYFDCFAGISGDMALGALVDAGADFEALKQNLRKLAVGGYEISAGRATTGGIAATGVTVEVTEHSHHGRGFSQIKRVIEESDLSERVKSNSTEVFRRLGEAEAKIHGKDIEEIHFHEVGAVDAIVDIVGTCIALELLGIEAVYASPVPTFHGTVEIAHGVYPLPAPATVEILAGVPWRKLDIEGEIVTPTGAAILAGLAGGFGAMPPMSVESTGYGAGTKDFGIPNVLRVMVGQGACEDENGTTLRGCVEVAVIESNIDDLSPQVYDVVMDRLFESGALDVYLTPIQMKKNRPATLLSVICEPGDVDKLSVILFEETSTIGLRIDRRTRTCLPRETVKVETRFGPIRAKVARRNDEVVNVQPEYDDCKAAAARHNVPVKRVHDAALAAFYSD